MDLKTPQIVGFGISNNETFVQATQFTSGAIIGSAFVKFLGKNSVTDIEKFIKSIVHPSS